MRRRGFVGGLAALAAGAVLPAAAAPRASRICFPPAALDAIEKSLAAAYEPLPACLRIELSDGTTLYFSNVRFTQKDQDQPGNEPRTPGASARAG